MMSPYMGSPTPHPASASASAGKSPALTMDLSTDIMSRVWVMIILFSVSLFGMSVSPPPPHSMHTRVPCTQGHGLRAVRHFCFRQLAVLTLPFSSCVVPDSVQTNTTHSRTPHRLLHRKALWHRCHPLNRFRTLVTGSVRESTTSPRQSKVGDRKVDWAHCVCLSVVSWMFL